MAMSQRGRVPGGLRRGPAKLPRRPRNASRPWVLVIGWRFERDTAGKQTMPGSVRQSPALAGDRPARDRAGTSPSYADAAPS